MASDPQWPRGSTDWAAVQNTRVGGCCAAALQTNFSVDGPAGKGVQCACHMQACKQHGDMQQSRNHFAHWRELFLSNCVHCSTAFATAEISFPRSFPAGPHSGVRGHVDERSI